MKSFELDKSYNLNGSFIFTKLTVPKLISQNIFACPAYLWGLIFTCLSSTRIVAPFTIVGRF